MKKYVLTCCSTADMPKEYLEKRDIPYVCFHYMLDGVEYPDDLGQSISFDEFYRRLAAGSMPTTSQVNVAQFIEFFTPFLEEGRDVLHVSLSSGISGAFHSAVAAQQELQKRYPERRILVVDSLAASGGYGMLMDLAADRRDAGASLEELHTYVEENKLKIHHWFFTMDLTHFKRGGRISAASAVAGSLLHICPVMNVSVDGKLIPRYKVRGKKKAIDKVVEKMEECAEGGRSYNGKCFITHSACYDDARSVAHLVEERFSQLKEPVKIHSIGAVIGSHTGPGTVALFFVGDERTD